MTTTNYPFSRLRPLSLVRLFGFALLFACLIYVQFTAVSAETAKTFFDLSARSIQGDAVSLNQYRGKVVLVVNTASKCGFTSQYGGLEELYKKYAAEGLVVLGFPSNDFRSQEPGSNEEIQAFCSEKFGVTFPLFEKNPVTGDGMQPVYKFLTDDSGYGAVLWNFEKFLISREGKVVDRWRSVTTPESSEIVSRIEEELAKSST